MMPAAYDKLRDDSGQVWEIVYEGKLLPVLDAEGARVTDADDYPRFTTQVTRIRYRKETENETEPWVELPPWAQPTHDFMVTLCMFDEDEETGDLEFWRVAPLAEVAT